MNQNNSVRVNKSRRNTRRSIFDYCLTDHDHLSSTHQPLQPQTNVYIIDKKDFKTVVQQLTSYQHCESSNLSQNNVPKLQKIGPANPVPEHPNFSRYMDYFKSCLDDESSDSNDQDQFQQPLQSQIPTQAQVVNQPRPYSNGLNQPMSYSNGFDQTMSYSNGLEQSMPYPNGLESVMSTTYPSHWFSDSSCQKMQEAYSFEQPSLQYPESLPSNSTFSSMNHPGVFGPDMQHP